MHLLNESAVNTVRARPPSLDVLSLDPQICHLFLLQRVTL